jgi:O-antigen ligase
VEWSVSYVAFLVYIFVIVTYRVDVADIAMIVALGGLLLERKFRIPSPLVLFGLFIGWSLVGYAGTEHPDVVSERLLLFCRLWLIILVAVNVLTSWARIRLFLVWLLVLFATHPVRGAIFNKYIYGFAEFGRLQWRESFGNPNDLAALTLLPLGIAAALLRDRSRWIRWGALASVVVLPALILLSQSRGGILALALFGILTLLGERRRLRTLALLGLVGVGIMLSAPTGAWERMEDLVTAYRAGDVGQADSSAEQRMTIWRVATDVIRENPTTGVGLGAYSQAHGEHAATSPEYSLAAGNRDVHNTFLGVLAETGWPGLLLFLALLINVIRDSIRTRRRLRGAASDQLRYLEFALYAYLLAGVFGTFFHLTFLYLHLALIVAFASVLRRQVHFETASADWFAEQPRGGSTARPARQVPA